MGRARKGWFAAMVVGATMLFAGTSEPAGADAFELSGRWQTRWGDAASTLDLQHRGPWVVGTYSSNASAPGALAGRLQGTTLVGRWTDPVSSGGFRLEFSRDGRTFSGTWGGTIDSVDSGGTWTGGR